MEKYEAMFDVGPEKKIALVAISVGFLMVLTSALGTLGICRRNPSIIKAFGFLVLTLLILQLAIGITVYALR